MKQHILVLDPTPFAGGSKVATLTVLRQLNSHTTTVRVLSSDPSSWSDKAIRHHRLFEAKPLVQQEQGLSYFARHLLIALQILLLRLRFGPFDIALGASGPGVDLAIYLAKPLLGYRIVQLIHGPVARSRTIARCLKQADQVYHLESSRDSLLTALATLSEAPTLPTTQYALFKNGLSKQHWPSRCQTETPVVFWAASLLKWKGLELLLDALKQIENSARPNSHICYIRPKETTLAVSQAPQEIDAVHWHLAPDNLDELRARANIFISTSEREPFGLSILEAMAAGHCVVIPADGAYWDRTLEDGRECIKYPAGDSQALASQLLALSQDMPRVKLLGNAARAKAELYRAEVCHQDLLNTLTQGLNPPSKHNRNAPHLESQQ